MITACILKTNSIVCNFIPNVNDQLAGYLSVRTECWINCPLWNWDSGTRLGQQHWNTDISLSFLKLVTENWPTLRQELFTLQALSQQGMPSEVLDHGITGLVNLSFNPIFSNGMIKYGRHVLMSGCLGDSLGN